MPFALSCTCILAGLVLYLLLSSSHTLVTEISTVATSPLVFVKAAVLVVPLPIVSVAPVLLDVNSSTAVSATEYVSPCGRPSIVLLSPPFSLIVATPLTNFTPLYSAVTSSAVIPESAVPLSVMVNSNSVLESSGVKAEPASVLLT